MNDSEAIQRMEAGDISGLEVLVLRYQARAVKAAFLILHDEQLAEDVVQDTFVRLYKQMRFFDLSRPFEPYLLRSVINAALNLAKKSRAWVPLDDGSDSTSVEGLITQAAAVEDQALSREARYEILNALAKLPPRQRVVIVQRYYLEMSEQEIVEALPAPHGTVKWLLNQARARLRELLEQKGAGNEE